MAITTATPAEVREWARENGYEIGERGRISSEIAMAFNKARRGRNARKFVSTEGASATALNVTGVRRGTNDNGEQVFKVAVTGELTFVVPS